MAKKKTYVYALDLALNSTGICIFTNDGKFVKTFTIDTHAEKETRLKLKLIGEYLQDLEKQYPPSIVVMEQGFSRFNASTQAVFRVHGLVNYLFSDYEQVYYPATTVKKVAGGKGNITKEKLREVILHEHPDLDFKNYDESDAYAAGVTYFLTRDSEKENENGKENL